MSKILITGGLGYIGSHIAYILKDKAIIIDDKSNSNLDYAKHLPLAKVIIGSVNFKNISNIFRKNNIDGVIHLAGLKSVNESISNPLKYYKKNVYSTLALLEGIDKFNIKKLIFSSSATVYGNMNHTPFKENYSLSSKNPYATTKILNEQLIDEYAKSNNKFRAASLRYFNPIGCEVKSGLIDMPKGNPSNLMPVLLNSLLKKEKLKIYGKNYLTSDGTCIRDYIHVSDLAKAHIVTYKKINLIKGHEAFNLGLGRGISVLELIKIFEQTNKIQVSYKFVPRRKGDVAISYACNKKFKKFFQWKPKKKYEDMCRDAWNGYFNKK